MSEISSLLSYYRSCYEADNNRQLLLDIFSKKFEQQIFLKEAEVLNGAGNRYAIDDEYGKNLQIELALHQKEKALYACPLFISGTTLILGREKKIMAPLFFFPLQLEQEGRDFFIRATDNPAQLNTGLVRILNANNKKVSIDDWVEFIQLDRLDFGICGRLASFLERSYSFLSSENLLLFPDFEEEKSLRLQKRKGTDFRIHMGISVALVEKPKSSSGVLNELSLLLETNDYSSSLRALFRKRGEQTSSQPMNKIQKLGERAIRLNKKGAIVSFNKRERFHPANLTESQKGILEASENFDLSLIMGPPGTGKSFSIAALAVDAILNGPKSILIAASSDEALDVLQEKISSQFGLKDLVMRAKMRYKGGSVVTKIRRILSGNVQSIETQQIDKQKIEINRLTKRIKSLRATYQAAEENETLYANLLQDQNIHWFKKLKRPLYRHRLKGKKNHWEIKKDLDLFENKLKKQVDYYLRLRIKRNWWLALEEQRDSIQNLYDGLSANRGMEREQFFEQINAKLLRNIFPVWLARLDELANVLPFKKELFDLVVIDEATQSDVAKSLPALQRGKNAVIAGDPEQLRHLSFLSLSQMQQIATRNNLKNWSIDQLNFRKKSLLDFTSSAIESQSQVHFLNEHYRSHPSIIAFSNEHFYGGNLKIMTTKPSTFSESKVQLYPVHGRREKSGINLVEAVKALHIIEGIIERDRSKPKKSKTSIGILSPFNDQVKYIKKLIKEKLPLKSIKNHRILIGTPHHFQGEERDEMILSFCVCNESHSAAFVHLNKSDVFNVSITRAKFKQHVLCSTRKSHLKQDSLLFLFLSQIVSKESTSDFEASSLELPADLLELINKEGRVYLDYKNGGIEIDVMIETSYGWRGIDLIGFKDQLDKSMSPEKIAQLNRVGIPVFPLSYSDWQFRNSETAKALKRFLYKVWK